MKMKYLLGTMLMAMALGMTFSSCEEDDDNTGIEVRISNTGGIIRLLRVDSSEYMQNYAYGDGWYGGSVEFSMTQSNNFKVMGDGDGYYGEGRVNASIACVGTVRNIGKINNVPSSGWSDAVAVQPGQGYIVRCKNRDYDNCAHFCHYARVYVEDWIEGTSGGIIGAIIRYEDNWKVDY